MRRVPIPLCALVLLALFAACRTATPAKPVPRFDALFSDLHARGLFDGAVVISEAGQVVFEKGYGYANVAQGVRFTPDTPADGGSLAKTFTAALLVSLHHERALSLDDAAQKYLPELPYPDVTLRHLLSHTSGIPVLDYDYFERYLRPDEVRTTETLLRVLAEQKPPLFSSPGTRFEYSSLGYDFAALAASRAAGKSYADLLAERFFRPLGITSAFLRPARLTDFPGVRTLGYRRVEGKPEVNDVFDFEAFHGGSNLYISARELDKWSAALLRPGLLAPAVLDEVQRFAEIGGSSSGLTLGSWYRTAEGDALWYSGHLQGFHSEVYRETAGSRSIVYVSNNSIEPWVQKAIVRAVVATMRGDVPAPLQPPAIRAIPKADRSLLTGQWSVPDGRQFAIMPTADHLSVVHGGVAYRLVPISSDTFYVPGLDWIVGFSGAAGAPPSQVYVSTNVSEQWGRRAL